MHTRRLVSLVVVTLAVVTLAACSGSNPAAPTAPPYVPPVPTTAQLTMRLDAACRGINVLGADFFVDGQIVQAASSGGSFTMAVTIGNHLVEAASYYANRVQGNHWGPYTVYVPATGYIEVFYCQ